MCVNVARITQLKIKKTKESMFSVGRKILISMLKIAKFTVNKCQALFFIYTPKKNTTNSISLFT